MKLPQHSKKAPYLGGRRGCFALIAVLAVSGVGSSWYGLQARSRHQTALQQVPNEPCGEASKLWFERMSKAALAAPWNSKDTFNTTTLIPHQIWQTSKSYTLGKRASMLHDSWKQLNPGMKVKLVNDTEAADFIASFYGPEVAQLYAAYPLGVMRADFWRYAVLYAYGGIYSDIDTQCLQPVAKWFPPKVPQPLAANSPVFVTPPNSSWQVQGTVQYQNLTWDDCSLVVGLENTVHMCQWTIAAAPGHPVLWATLQEALRSLEQGLLCGYDHMVHAHTGPGTWTAGVRNALGLPAHYSAGDMATAVWTDPAVYQRARDVRLCIMSQEFFGEVREGNKRLSAQNVMNHYSSQWRDEPPNIPWGQEQKQMQARLKAGKQTEVQGATATASGR